MEKYRCDSCFWGRPFCDKKIECHFNAPTVLHGSGTGWSDDKWPTVKYDDYCSEYSNYERGPDGNDNES